MNTSQFMDKQIMDLSNSQSSNNNTDFLDLINPPAGTDSDKKEEMLPSYDFQPIRPAGSSSSPSKLDSAAAAATGAPRAWNSVDNNNASASGTRNYTSMDSYEPARYVLENDQTGLDANLVSEIDRTMKKYADNLMHGLDGISARVSQLESRTRHLESSLDELKVSVGTNYGSSDGRMRQLENILREVNNGVQTIRDKQEIMDARLELAKLQLPKAEQHADVQSTEHVDSSSQATMSVNQQPHQQFPPAPLTHPSSAPPPPPNAPQQNIQPQFQLPGHYPPGQIPSGPPPPPPASAYFAPPPPPPGQAPENNLSQQYQLQAPSQPSPQHQYQQPPQLPYSQPPAPPQPHNPLPSGSSSQPHLPLAHHHPEDSPYGPPQSYPPAARQNAPPPPTAVPPQQQFYGAPANMYEPPPPNRPGPGFSGSFGPSAGSGEQFPYGSPSSQYGSPVKPPQQMQSSSSGYPQLPTARILPHAVPTASTVGSGPGSPASGNKVPIDDVVDKVTSMGFSREQVRATVRRLTENGQAVDLNIVLDKLMNDGDVQPPRGWFNR